MGNHHVGFILSEDKDFDVKVINALAQRSRYESKVAFIKKAIVYYANHAKDEATGVIVSDNTSIEDILRSLNDTAEWVRSHYRVSAGVIPGEKPGKKTAETARKIRPAEKTVKAPEKEPGEDIRAGIPVREGPEAVQAEAGSDDDSIEVDDGFFSDFLDDQD